MPAPSRSTAVLVLGMHRSGTSALTRLLQELGLPLGSELVTAGPDNPGGYFEHAGAVTLNDVLLAALGRGWEDPRPLPADWLQTPAARQAAQAIEALVRRDFPEAALWALKDPRLCRLLPLWREVLQELGIRCKCLLMLRHPDEVAASLGARDGIDAPYAYLLWLQHVLDAERDSRSGERAVLTYDRLLSDPAASLAAAGKELGIRWPVAPAAKALTGLMDLTQRHHRASPEGAATGLRRWALAVYAQLEATAQIDPQTCLFLDRRLARWNRQLEPWIAGMGSALARERRAHGDTRRRFETVDCALAEARQLSMQRLDALHATHARLAETDTALQSAEAMSMQRLDELRATHARLADTDAALQSAEAMSMQRLDELRAIHVRLAHTDAALQGAEAMSMQRLDELRATHVRLADTDVALQASEAMSLQRLDQLGVLGAQLADTEAGFVQATRLAVARLDELQGVQGRLQQTDAALDAAERLARTHLHDLQTLDARLTLTSTALRDAEAMSMQRLDELAHLDQRLQATDAALQEADRLAGTRATALAALDARLAATDRALQTVTALSQARLDELQALGRQLADTDVALNAASALALQRQAELLAQEARLGHAESAQAEAERLAVQRLQAWEKETVRGEQLREAMATAGAAHAAESRHLHGRLQATESTLLTMARTRSWRYTRQLRAVARWFGRDDGILPP